MFRAYDSQREHLVAVKLFKLDLAPERVHQLAAELNRIIAAGLTHAALAAPLETGIHEVWAYLVQHYVAAESLDLAVREYGPAPAADALRVAAQLAGALDVAAAADITHGSLHPRDVLFSSDATRLTGIGVARALERVGVEPPVRRPYSAPERMAGVEWDRRADVFSLAALMHELLWARRVSGTGAQAVESLTEIEGGDLSALRATFARALAEDPADRYQTALAFADALRLAFPGVAIDSLQSSVPSPQSAVVSPQSAVVRPQSSARPANKESRLPLEDAPDLIEPMPPVSPDLAVRAALRAEDLDRSMFAFGAADESFSAIPADVTASRQREPLTVPDRPQSTMWPLVLALIVGLTLGFAGGYGAGTRARPAAITTAAAPPATPDAPVGREFTESAVAGPAQTPASPAARPASPEAATKSEGGRLKSEDAGRLLVRSTPSGARVLVDGREYGQTPVAVRNLAPGAHRVRIARDGYVTDERRVVITPSQPAQSMTVALERPGDAASRNVRTTTVPATPETDDRFFGTLVVDSRPVGARVFMDGQLVGATPLALPTVRAGEHAIHLERDGYRRWSSSVRIVASERSRVTASLER